MSFEKNKYTVIKDAISKEKANFIYRYFLLKRKVSKTFFDTNYIHLLQII